MLVGNTGETVITGKNRMEWRAPRGSKLSGRCLAEVTQNPYLLTVVVRPVSHFSRTTKSVPAVVSLGYLAVTPRGANTFPLTCLISQPFRG